MWDVHITHITILYKSHLFSEQFCFWALKPLLSAWMQWKLIFHYKTNIHICLALCNFSWVKSCRFSSLDSPHITQLNLVGFLFQFLLHKVSVNSNSVCLCFHKILDYIICDCSILQFIRGSLTIIIAIGVYPLSMHCRGMLKHFSFSFLHYHHSLCSSHLVPGVLCDYLLQGIQVYCQVVSNKTQPISHGFFQSTSNETLFNILDRIPPITTDCSSSGRCGGSSSESSSSSSNEGRARRASVGDTGSENMSGRDSWDDGLEHSWKFHDDSGGRQGGGEGKKQEKTASVVNSNISLWFCVATLYLVQHLNRRDRVVGWSTEIEGWSLGDFAFI